MSVISIHKALFCSFSKEVTGAVDCKLLKSGFRSCPTFRLITIGDCVDHSACLCAHTKMAVKQNIKASSYTKHELYHAYLFM